MMFVALALASCVIDQEGKTDYSVRDNSQSAILFLHSPTCGYSNAAKKYITETYPNAAIWYVDIDERDNSYFLKAACQDYGLDKNDISTPVICLGDNFIEGWDFYKREKLDVLIQRYLKEK